MGKHIYTYKEERITPDFAASWFYRTYQRRGGISGWINGVEYTMPELLFFVSGEVPFDDDVLEALEFYTDKEGWSWKHRAEFVIVEDVIHAERPEFPMVIKDGEGWSKIHHIGERAIAELKPVNDIVTS